MYMYHINVYIHHSLTLCFTVISSHSLNHILHVPNHNERTTEFQVESDLDCVTGPPSITIAGGDLVDYPLLIRPIRRGVLSGAVAFVAQAPSSRNR